MSKVHYVGDFRPKERGGPSYENTFDDTMRRTPDETRRVIEYRTARARRIKAANANNRGKM
jgi:hypothetical protein